MYARQFHERFGVGILNGYGQTELGGEVIGWSAADWKEFGPAKLGAVGRPHAGIEVRVVDDELQVRSAKAAPADPATLGDGSPPTAGCAPATSRGSMATASSGSTAVSAR